VNSAVLYIPIDAIFKDQANDFVYVKTNSVLKGKLSNRSVNSDFAIVTDGLNENEELH